MNRAKTTFRCFMLGFAMLSGLRVSASPADLAEDLAALVAEGRGVLMPNLDEAHVEYRGVQVLPGDFPGDFLLGLIPVMEHGVTVYPKPNALAPERADGKMAGIKQKRGV